MLMQPSPIADTSRPLLPSLRFSMVRAPIVVEGEGNSRPVRRILVELRTAYDLRGRSRQYPQRGGLAATGSSTASQPRDRYPRRFPGVDLGTEPAGRRRDARSVSDPVLRGIPALEYPGRGVREPLRGLTGIHIDLEPHAAGVPSFLEGAVRLPGGADLLDRF